MAGYVIDSEGRERNVYYLRKRPEVQDFTIQTKHPSVLYLAKSTSLRHASILNEPGVYVITLLGSERLKIGFTSCLSDRIYTLETGCPFPLTALAFMPGGFALENELHVKLAQHRVHREWFCDVRPVRAELTRAVRRTGGVSILAQRIGHEPPGFEPVVDIEEIH